MSFLDAMIEYAKNTQDILVVPERVLAPTRVLAFVPMCVVVYID